MMQDAKQDGVETARKVIEDGFGVRISLSGHDMNGFAIGPDGRVWGTIGDRGFNVTTKEGKKYDSRNRGAVFRFEPDGTNFESSTSACAIRRRSPSMTSVTASPWIIIPTKATPPEWCMSSRVPILVGRWSIRLCTPSIARSASSSARFRAG